MTEFQTPLESNIDFGTQSDSKWLAEKLSNLSIEEILSVLIPIRGEYSFILYHTITKQIVFGRDRLGRRSLILSASDNHFGLVSVGVIKAGSKF